MIQLTDLRWKEFEGGYRMPYDASVPLMRMEKALTSDEIDAIFAELWNELHHQGDVGLASYFAVPHLIRIAKAKELFNFNVFGLIATIEIERHRDNPPLPKEFEAEYLQALSDGIADLVKMGLAKEWDLTLASTILSALAVSKGHIMMGNAISKMEDEKLTNEFLENY
jgi:hypothetical protein